MTRAVLIVLALFFGAMLVPHFVPAAGETMATIYYLFAVFVVLILLFGCLLLWIFVRRKAPLVGNAQWTGTKGRLAMAETIDDDGRPHRR